MSVLGKLTDEYFKETERDEDKIIFNIPDMEFVDMGGSVLWADKDLSIVGDLKGMKYYEFFSFNEMKNMKLGELRLPTINEFLELYNDGIKGRLIKADRNAFTFSFGENKITFAERGFYKNDGNCSERFAKFAKLGSTDCSRMTSEIPFGRKDGVYIFNANMTPPKNKHCCDIADVDWQYLPVRLVKNK